MVEATNLKVLEKQLKLAWSQIGPDILDNLVDSMPGRVKTCVKLNGGYFGKRLMKYSIPKENYNYRFDRALILLHPVVFSYMLYYFILELSFYFQPFEIIHHESIQFMTSNVSERQCPLFYLFFVWMM